MVSNCLSSRDSSRVSLDILITLLSHSLPVNPCVQSHSKLAPEQPPPLELHFEQTMLYGDMRTVAMVSEPLILPLIIITESLLKSDRDLLIIPSWLFHVEKVLVVLDALDIDIVSVNDNLLRHRIIVDETGSSESDAESNLLTSSARNLETYEHPIRVLNVVNPNLRCVHVLV